LKRKHCIRGRKLLYEYLENNDITYQKCGKIIFSLNADSDESLNNIFQNSIRSNVKLNYLSAAEIKNLPSFIKPRNAVHSPETGIFDTGEYLNSLLYNFEENGGLAINSTRAVEFIGDNGLEVVCESPVDRFRIKCQQVINAAGANALNLIQSLYPDKYMHYSNFYVKGHYFNLNKKLLVDKLYYPIPSDLGLGVHLTIDLNGQVKFGPDTLEVENPHDYLQKTSIQNMHDAIAKNFRNIGPDDISFSYSGVRPKIKFRSSLYPDFCILSDNDGRIISLLGIESPGLTSSLSIAQDVSCLIKI